jgi:hypothetical protein
MRCSSVTSGIFLHCLGEALDPSGTVTGGFDHHEYGGRKIDQCRVEQGNGALDHAGRGQALNASPAGGFRQADSLADVFGAQGGITLQYTQYFPVDGVQATNLCKWRRMRNIVA